MPNLKDMRSKIRSVQNTQQITGAMKMVSSAKLHQAQESILRLRPYALHLLSFMADIASTQKCSTPLLRRKKNPKHILLFVITSDRGLCGSFNNNINKFAEKYYRENQRKHSSLDLFIIGKKALEYFKGRGIQPIKSLLNLSRRLNFSLSLKVAQSLMESYTKGQYDEVRFIYNSFQSVMVQKLTIETILPVDLSSSTLTKQKGTKFSKDLLFEPEPEKIIEELLKKHFSTQVYRCLSESVAAEHAARRVAMENATNNARDMLTSLQLKYNKIRQASITKELIEITSGAEAL